MFGEYQTPHLTTRTNRQAGCWVMVWARVCRHGIWKPYNHWVHHKFFSILSVVEENVRPSAQRLRLGRQCITNNQREPQHTSKAAYKWMAEEEKNIFGRMGCCVAGPQTSTCWNSAQDLSAAMQSTLKQKTISARYFCLDTLPNNGLRFLLHWRLLRIGLHNESEISYVLFVLFRMSL